ncbi:MAG: hypothetical protein JWO32_2382 [Bacteroidetes bacterium]|nr:hypothetical protein [Bacteroidota bacterium]
MANVAFLFTGIGNLSGGGGAERFFSGFFDEYKYSSPKFNLFFITDNSSLKNLSEINALKDKKNILTYSIVNNRFKNLLESLQLIGLIIRHRIKMIQIPLYHIQYYPLIKAIDKLPGFIRPKIVIIITDAFIPHFYNDDKERGYNFKKILGGLFNTIKIDAVISWYELFKTFVIENNIIKSKPRIYCINSRYSNKKFNTNTVKKNLMVYASRLTIAKQPMFFVEALRILKEKNIDLKDWHFFMYGKGNLENEIRSKITEYGLNNLLTVSHQADLTSVFEQSKCFVSTQDFENFPSLSMNEAMAAGNAIIARNVGQTSLFVRHKVNGLLSQQDNEQGLAEAIEQYIEQSENHETMGKESIKLTTEVHTFENFKTQIEFFWSKILHTDLSKN